MLALLSLKLVKYIFPFLFLAIISIIGFRYIIFKTVINYKKTEFRQNLIKQKQNNTLTINVSQDQLYKDKKGIEWKEGGKEVLINGKYYEVISVSRRNDSYIVSLSEDVKENEVFKTYFDLEETNEELPYDILSDLELDFFLPTSQETFFQNQEIIAHCTKYLYADIPSVYFRIIKPPCV